MSLNPTAALHTSEVFSLVLCFIVLFAWLSSLCSRFYFVCLRKFIVVELLYLFGYIESC